MIRSTLILLFALLSSHFSFAQCEDFSVEINHTNPTCPDYWDGSITLVIEGVPPYDIDITDSDGYIVNPDGGPATGNYLSAGWYYITLIDSEGCVFIDSVLLIDPTEMLLESYELTDPSAYGECDGSIIIEDVSGEFEELYYAWSPDPDDISGIGANAMTAACAGIYTVVIQDEVGCAIAVAFEIGADLDIQENLGAKIKINSIDNQIIINSEISEDVAFTVYSLDGKSLTSIDVKTGINTINLPVSGMVFYTLSTERGELIKRGKCLLGN